MYSVLIVDDEEPVLESYTYLIERGLDDFKVCGTARSGTEALAVAHQQRPDVVLMDIAMPGIDGLDTIREMQLEHPEALYILSTAYERFDLAQRAIPLRVFAYLVKPVSRKRFMETLFHAKDHLDAQAERLRQRIAETDAGGAAREQEEHNFMLLLTWKAFDDGTWERYRRLFQLTSDWGCVAALELERPDVYVDVVRRVERRYRCLSARYMERLILFVPDQTTPEALERFMLATAQEVVDPHESVRVGVGARCRYHELFRSCDEALRRLGRVEQRNDRVVAYRNQVKAFVNSALRARHIDDAVSAYRDLADVLFATWRFRVAGVRMAAAFERLVHEAAERRNDPAAGTRIGDPTGEVGGLETRGEVDAWAYGMLRRVLEELRTREDDHLPVPLQRAVRYIARNYSSPLQIADIAERGDISAGHLSRLFSEHMACTFNEHLNGVRVEAAKRMLRDDGASVKETAYAVGYHDPNYFSRIFKRCTGWSPSEYGAAGGSDG